MAITIQQFQTGACRLFGKFLLILVPIFVASCAIGLSLIAEYNAQRAQNELTARLGTQAAYIAGALDRHYRDTDKTVSQDLLSTLLSDRAVLCAEVKSKTGGVTTLKAPRGVGCAGQDSKLQFSVPVGAQRGEKLSVRFTSDEVEVVRQSHREFSVLAMLFGLLVFIGACYFGFRLVVGKPLKALLSAIRQFDEKGTLTRVPVSGSDELSDVIHAYNTMQENLEAQVARVIEKSTELTNERHRNEKLLSKVFQVSPYPFAILDLEDGTYLNVNEAWLSTMGFAREDVIGQSAVDLGIWVDATDRGHFIGKIKVVGSVHDYETKVRTKTGDELDMLISGEFVKLGGDARLFMVADDVTELKKAETAQRQQHNQIVRAKAALEDTNEQLVLRTQELEAAQETLVQQERLATLGELTATVSHELRNPLAAINSSVHLAIKKTEGLDLGVARSLERASRNVLRCDDIISDLLGFTREPECQSQVILADQWLSATLSELDVREDVEFVMDLCGPDVRLTGAPERLRQAVVNVFENAMQVLAEVPSGRTRRLTVKSLVEAGDYLMVFEDTGPGMDSEKVANVFKPLFSTKSYGCGLGLATTKKIIEKHEDGIRFESEIGVGTTVTINLPMEHNREQAA